MTDRIEQLTDREREVLYLLLAGHTAKSTAAELDLSVHTVNDYLREARKKLGVGSSKEAARILAELESSPPQNIAPDQFGIARTGAFSNSVRTGIDRGDSRRIGLWIIGGSIMFASILTIALLAASQGNNDADIATDETISQDDIAAETTASNWIRLIDEGQYETSWQQAGGAFKNAVTASAWAAQVEPVRKPLGSVVARNLKSVDARTELPGVPAGDYNIVQFDTDFTEATSTVETVVMAKEAGAWNVVGYFIR